MTDDRRLRLLTVNSGSSSLKFSIYEARKILKLELKGSLDRIGLKRGLFEVRDAQGRALERVRLDLPDHETALKKLLAWLEDRVPGQSLDAAGHRLVHGGSTYRRPQRITPALLRALEGLVRLAPEHLPHEIKAIKVLAGFYPDLEQVACFDTSFHMTMPEVARLYALPAKFRRQGVRRYGFHGLSYEYILDELRREAGRRAARARVIIAHLGNGASMAAVHRGKSLETTMGFTPAGGLVMSTRTGDLDPGVVLFLLAEKGMSPASVSALVNHRSGLLAVSGLSSSMKDLLAREARNSRAAEAVALFCYQARKSLGALAAVLGGLDTLVFTGGIGENSPPVRGRICRGLEYLGVYLDPSRNTANAPVISREKSGVTIRVIKTNEELMVARHTLSLLRRRLPAARWRPHKHRARA
jgi:acetate kinase